VIGAVSWYVLMRIPTTACELFIAVVLVVIPMVLVPILSMLLQLSGAIIAVLSESERASLRTEILQSLDRRRHDINQGSPLWRS